MNIREIRFTHPIKVPGTSDLKNGIQHLFDGRPAWDIIWDGGGAVEIRAVPGSRMAQNADSFTLVPIGAVVCMVCDEEEQFSGTTLGTTLVEPELERAKRIRRTNAQMIADGDKPSAA